MQTHSPFPNTTFRGSGSGIHSAVLKLNRIDSVAESMPRLTCFRPCGDAGANGGSHQSGEQGIVGSQGVLVSLEPTLFKKPHHSSCRSCHDPSHVLCCGRGQRDEGPGGVGRAAIHAIQDEAMKMWIQVESRAKPLYEGDDTGPGAAVSSGAIGWPPGRASRAQR